MSAGRSHPAEEPWERQIHELLSSLPPVDPPEGFLERAIDHRPKYAARLSAAALATVLLATLVIVGFGLVGDPSPVAPPVGNLGERHARATAGFSNPRRSDGAPAIERLPDEPEVLELPATFEPQASLRDGELVQVLYTHQDETISVFLQRGKVAWGDLPAEGRGRAGGRPVWTDHDRRIVVFEAGGFAVCVVGMDVDRALSLLGGSPSDRITVTDRFKALAREVARQAGFP